MKYCPKCTIEIDDKFAFCPKCGSKLQEVVESNFCPYCGNRIETEGAFCPYCGNSMNDEQAGTTPAPKKFNQYTPVNISQNNSINDVSQSIPEEKEEGNGKSTSALVIKTILYVIGGFFLLFVMKVLTKGMVKSYMRQGFSLSFVIAGIIVGLIIYYFLYKNKD